MCVCVCVSLFVSNLIATDHGRNKLSTLLKNPAHPHFLYNLMSSLSSLGASLAMDTWLLKLPKFGCLWNKTKDIYSNIFETFNCVCRQNIPLSSIKFIYFISHTSNVLYLHTNVRFTMLSINKSIYLQFLYRLSLHNHA